MSAARNLLDQTLDDRYRVRGELGRNDSGILYNAEDVRDGGRITLQVLRPELGQHAELRASFLEASLALTHAEHEHLIGVVGAGVTHDALCYVALHPIEGSSLGQLLRHEALTTAQACGIVSQILAGLHAAHAAGVVHGRLRPSDIWVVRDQEGQPSVKLLGFGLAKYRPHAASAADLQSLAPECWHGSVSEPSADLFSVAAILFELLVGCPPFEGDTAEEVRTAAQRGEALALTSLRPDLPPALVSLVEAGLSPDPKGRPTSAVEFGRRLERFGAPVSLPQLSEHQWRSPIPEPPASRPSRMPTQRPSAAAEAPRASHSDPVIRYSTKGDASEFLALSESLLMDPRIPPPAATPNLEDDRARHTSGLLSLNVTRDLSQRSLGWALLFGAIVGALLSWLAGVL